MEFCMFRPPFFAPLAGCLLSLACAQAFAASSPYSTMVVFGDSLADAGQFPDGSNGATLRFTNRTGPTFQGDTAWFRRLCSVPGWVLRQTT